MKNTVILGLVLVSQLLATEINENLSKGPSFDCTKASTYVEDEICKYDQLSRLDIKLATLYRQTKSISKEPKIIRNTQRSWIKTRGKCKSFECIEKSFIARIKEVKKDFESISNEILNDVMPNKLDYEIREGMFYTSQGKIPKGCFGQLTIKLNGDDTVAAIYINRTVLRGCIRSNIPYPGGKEEDVSYDIVESLKDDKFKVKVCEKVDGSMRETCDKLIIQFANRKYLSRDGSKQVLSIEKLGEW